MSKALTDAGIRKLAKQHAGQRVNISDPGCHGLKLRLGAAGRKTWALYYWVAGRQRTYTIGEYPEPWGLADAREEARRLQRLISQGGDPAQERRQARQQAPTAAISPPPSLSVDAVIEAYLADLGARARPATVRNWSRALRVDVAPRIGHLAPEAVRRADVRALLAGLKPAGAVVTYNALRACWRWLGVVDGSGAGHLLHPGLVEGVPVDLVVLEVDRLAGRGRGHLGQVGPLPTLGLSGAYGVRRSDGEAEKSIR